MKSRLIPAVFPDRDAEVSRVFRRDLNQLLSLSELDRSACLEALAQHRLARTTGHRKAHMDALMTSVEAERDSIENALSVLRFLLDALMKRDTPERDYDDWASDLLEYDLLANKHMSTFKQVVDYLVSKILPEVAPLIKERRAASGVLPVLASGSASVEMRAVRETLYRWGRPVDEYEPEVVGVTPIASIHICVDEGQVEDLYFQADEQDLEFLISMLLAAKKDIRALRAYFAIGKER